jgi:hypothetical protein
MTPKSLALAVVALLAACGTAACASSYGAEAEAEEQGAMQSSRQAGFSIGRWEGTREGTSANAFLDAIKPTFTSRGRFTLQSTFDPTSESEGKAEGLADLHQMTVELTFDDYVKLFESSDSVTLPRRYGMAYWESAEATGPKSARRVVIQWDNDDDGEPTMRGSMELDVSDGTVRSFALKKELRRRGLFAPRSYETVFEGRVSAPRRTGTGLMLLDDAFLGRITGRDAIVRACDDFTPSTFQELLRAQRGR